MDFLPQTATSKLAGYVETRTFAAAQAPKMQRQGSDPLRLESLVNQWDEDGAIPMLHGHLPSLHMNPSLQVGLAHVSPLHLAALMCRSNEHVAGACTQQLNSVDEALWRLLQCEIGAGFQHAAALRDIIVAPKLRRPTPLRCMCMID